MPQTFSESHHSSNEWTAASGLQIRGIFGNLLSALAFYLPEASLGVVCSIAGVSLLLFNLAAWRQADSWPKAGEGMFLWMERDEHKMEGLAVSGMGRGWRRHVKRQRGWTLGTMTTPLAVTALSPGRMLPLPPRPLSSGSLGHQFEGCTPSLLWEGPAVPCGHLSCLCHSVWHPATRTSLWDGLLWRAPGCEELPFSIALLSHCKLWWCCWAGAAACVYVLQPRMSWSSFVMGWA